MAAIQKYGIKYPFSSENEEGIYLDLNETYSDMVKSQVLHVLFTPKGQRLMNPDFGTDLIKYIFDQNDTISIEDLKTSLRTDIAKYVSGVEFNDISIYTDENDDNSKIVIVHYSVIKGENREQTSVSVKI